MSGLYITHTPCGGSLNTTEGINFICILYFVSFAIVFVYGTISRIDEGYNRNGMTEQCREAVRLNTAIVQSLCGFISK